MSWYQFDNSKDPNAPSARECHSIDTIGHELVVFGGNDESNRMNYIHVLDTGASRSANECWRGCIATLQSCMLCA
jgi:hypothetical protein